MLDHTDATTTYLKIPFQPSLADWQQVSRVVEAPKDFYQASVKLVFDGMPVGSSAWFDDIKLNVLNVPSSTISAYNYADNSSFEYDYDSTSWPDGWYRSSGNGTFTSQWVDLTTSNGNVYTGARSIKMTNPTSWESATRTDEKVPFDSSKTYTAVGYIKTESVTSSAVVLVHAYDANGTWLGEVASQTVSGTKDWTRVSAVVNSSNVPSGTVKLAVGVQMRAGTGTAYFDNVRLQAGDFRYQLGYDANGNYVTSIKDPLGNQVSLSPEATTGNVKSFTNALGSQYSYNHDMMNRLTTFTFPYQGAIGSPIVNKTYSYQYDSNGNLQSVTDPNGQSWVNFTYNELNQVKQFTEQVTIGSNTYPNSWGYQYDTSGRLSKGTLPFGQFTSLAYDNAGRLTQVDFGNGSTVSKSFSYGYDLNGNLTSFGGYTAEYDNMNRATKVTESNPDNYLQNTYDAGGQRTQLSVHWGVNVWNYEYGYDSVGRAKTFHDVTANRDSRYLFDESGRMVKAYHSNGTSAFYDYNPAGQVTQVRVEKAGETINKFHYEYDGAGNITKIWSDMDSSWVAYTYDSLNQLVKETYSDTTTIEYQYDEMGNRTKVINNGVSTTYTYNPQKNRLLSVGSKNYQYDANGNVTADGTYTYVWGDDNKLKEVKQGTTTIASFTYDALGRRETTTAGGVTKTYHYDGDLVTYVTESSGKVYRFAYDHGGRPIFMSYNGNQYWYHYDQHGNVIRMTDATGATVAAYKYDAWGNITSSTPVGSEIKDLNPFRYSGYWYDNETGKYYLKARYYDSQIGRFLSKDPITVFVGSQLSLNAYAYAGNEPVGYVDTSGLMPKRADRETPQEEAEDVQLYSNMKKYGSYNPEGTGTSSITKNSKNPLLTILGVPDKGLSQAVIDQFGLKSNPDIVKKGQQIYSNDPNKVLEEIYDGAKKGALAGFIVGVASSEVHGVIGIIPITLVFSVTGAGGGAVRGTKNYIIGVILWGPLKQ